jgi:hypothetical protein
MTLTIYISFDNFWAVSIIVEFGHYSQLMFMLFNLLVPVDVSVVDLLDGSSQINDVWHFIDFFNVNF